MAKLGGATGGVEPDFLGAGDGDAGAKDGASAAGPANKKGPRRDPFAVTFAVKPMAQQIVTEARVERDASGRIVRVLDGRRENPLRDPLVQFDSDSEAGEEEAEDAEEWGGIDEDEDEEDEDEEDEGRPSVVMELERQAGRPLEKRLRHTSRGEGEWLERLAARHGDDAAAMARDRKLNPMQQTEADISRRLRRWRAGSAKA